MELKLRAAGLLPCEKRLVQKGDCQRHTYGCDSHGFHAESLGEHTTETRQNSHPKHSRADLEPNGVCGHRFPQALGCAGHHAWIDGRQSKADDRD